MVCDLVEAKLSHKPQYEALSYRWTDPNKENPDLAYCNGFECPIGPNLHAALIRFRLIDVPRALWVDQLCINQAQGPEMAQQLLVMCNIYSKAERVLAWLGPAYDDSDKAMDLFPKLVDRLEALDLEKKLEKGDQDMRSNSPAWYEASPLPELERNNLKALYKLFSRPYFSRMWTLQELAVGNDVVIVCGDAEFSFAVLARFIKGYHQDEFGCWAHARDTLDKGEGNNDLAIPRKDTHFRVVLILKDLQSSAYPLSSASVLNLLRDLECSKADDRVYSILRFLPLTLAQNLAVVKRRSTEALFIDLANFELTQNRSMCFLAAAGMCQHRSWCSSRRDDQLRPILKLPSWVPDWTCLIVNYALWEMNEICIQNGHGPLYQATGTSRGDARSTVTDGSKSLCVRAALFDEIAACMKPYGTPIGSKTHREEENSQVPEMNKTQKMEYCDDCGYNGTVECPNSFVEHMKHQADSCMAQTKSCKMYGDGIGKTTACHQTLIGGTISSKIQAIGSGVPVKATAEEANELFTEWDILLEGNKLVKRTSDVKRTYDVKRTSDVKRKVVELKEYILILSRAQETMEKLDNVKWPLGYPVVAMNRACRGRRFFTTTKGFMGLAPAIAQVGDKVGLIAGCCTPFIIRPDGPNYALVGESYVHGVMDGELMSDITFEDINLV